MLSMKDLIFKERLVRKLVDQYISPYFIDKVISTNVVKLWLSNSMRIYLVVNISQIVWYKEQVERQEVKEVKLIVIEEVEGWEDIK